MPPSPLCRLLVQLMQASVAVQEIACPCCNAHEAALRRNNRSASRPKSRHNGLADGAPPVCRRLWTHCHV